MQKLERSISGDGSLEKGTRWLSIDPFVFSSHAQLKENSFLMTLSFKKRKRETWIYSQKKSKLSFQNKRPGLCWGKLHQEYFADSGFSIFSIFGLAVSNLKSDFPDAALEHRNPEIHKAFLDFLESDSGFAFFCRKVSFYRRHFNSVYLIKS